MGRYTGLALVVSLSIACAAPAALRADVEAYLHHMSSWAPVEAETSRALQRILATEFVEAAEVLRQISDSSPRIQRHLREIEQYRPRTPDIRRIHAHYTDAWRGLLEAYAAIEAGLSGADQSRLAEGRKALLRWRASLLEVAHDLRELSERFDLSRQAATGGIDGRRA